MDVVYERGSNGRNWMTLVEVEGRWLYLTTGGATI